MAVRSEKPAQMQVIAAVSALIVGITAISFYASGPPPQGATSAEAGAAMPGAVSQQVEAYKQIVANEPKNVRALTSLGNLYYDSGKWLQATEYYLKVLKINPANNDVRTDMATAYFNLAMNDVAEEHFRKVVKNDPSHVNAAFNLGVLLNDTGRQAEAAALWRKVQPIAPPELAAKIKELLGQGAR